MIRSWVHSQCIPFRVLFKSFFYLLAEKTQITDKARAEIVDLRSSPPWKEPRNERRIPLLYPFYRVGTLISTRWCRLCCCCQGAVSEVSGNRKSWCHGQVCFETGALVAPNVEAGNERSILYLSWGIWFLLTRNTTEVYCEGSTFMCVWPESCACFCSWGVICLQTCSSKECVVGWQMEALSGGGGVSMLECASFEGWVFSGDQTQLKITIKMRSRVKS